MARRKNKKRKKIIIKQIIACTLIIFFIFLFSMYIYKKDALTPKINELTTSYVSFYNQDTTDMLKITNIEKMSDKKGKSKYNQKELSFEITKEDKSSYDVILYVIQNEIDEKEIKVYVKGKNKSIIKKLSSFPKNEDGGRIIYSNNSNQESILIRMWLSENYNEKISDTSFEVKIKQR